MRQEFRGYGVFLFLLGIALLIVAGILAGKTTVEVHTPGVNGVGDAPNIAGGLAVLGFAVAGGFSFVAAAIIYIGDRLAEQHHREKHPTPPPQRSDVPPS